MHDFDSSAELNRDGSSTDEHAFLDRLLSQVGGPDSVSPAKRRTRRKLRRNVLRTQIEEAEQPPSIPLRASRKGPIRIPIQHRSHVQSPFLVTVRGLVQPIQKEVRTPRERTIHRWSLPTSQVVSSETLLVEAIDLHVPDIDPFVFHHQFTPGDADVAFQEAYTFWARVRAPFVRWEVGQAVRRAKTGGRLPKGRVSRSEDEYLLPADFEHQFTSGEETSRLTLSYRLAVLRHRFSQFFAHTAEEAESLVADVEARGEEVLTQTEEAWGVPVLVPRLDFVKVFGGLAGLLLIASLPAGAVSLSRSFRGTVEESLQQSRSAVEEVARVSDSDNPLLDAPSALAVASTRFRAAEDGLRRVNGLTTLIVSSLPQTRDAYRSSVALLDAGTQATKAGRLLAEGVQEALKTQVRYPVERITTLQTYVQAALPLLRAAQARMGEVQSDALPMQEGARVAQARTAIDEGASSLQEVASTLDFLRVLLGESREQTYLLVFQNQAELRPSGGFMGSVAEIMMDRGEIKNVFVPGGGPYDLRGQLKSRVLAPEPLHLVNPRWEFQDANWFPDFAATAEKIRWFWSQGGQSTLDGVIAINASVLEPLLRFTGPVELPEYGKTFTAENIQLELQKAVELEYDKEENKPKKIIGDLFPVLLERLKTTSPEDLLRLASVLDESLQRKDIQLWFRAEELQAYAERYGWAGRLKPTQGDTFGLVGANIGGQKTDTVIHEAVDQRVHILPDGHIETTVTLDRTHTGEWGELFRGVNNVEYVRLYAPLGSELVAVEGVQPPPASAYKEALPQDKPDQDVERLVTLSHTGVGGVDITQEFGRTAFGAWVQLRPGATSRTTFTYRLPFTVQELSERAMADYAATTESTGGAYTLYAVSQSGKTDRAYTLHIQYPTDWRIRWMSREDMKQSPGLLTWSGALDRDQVFALSFMAPSLYDKTNSQQKER